MQPKQSDHSIQCLLFSLHLFLEHPQGVTSYIFKNYKITAKSFIIDVKKGEKHLPFLIQFNFPFKIISLI